MSVTGRGMSLRSGTGRRTLRKIWAGSGTLGEVRDGSLEPP